MSTTAVVGATIWPGQGEIVRRGTILMKRGRIIGVGASDRVTVPEDASTIDANGKTVIPGLIDSHVHLSSNSDLRVRTTPTLFHATTNSNATTLHTLRNAQRALAMGFTTLRTMGHRDGGAQEVKAFSEAGLIALPRVYLAPWPVTMTAGHGDHLRPPEEERRKFDTADGIDEMRQIVRKQMGHGADFIKVFASGGVFGGHGDSVNAPNYTVEELQALVEEAHTYGLPVAAHGHSLEGIRRAVAAGVDSLEHGTFADDEQLKRMLDQGTFLVPTLTIQDQVLKNDGDTLGGSAAREEYQRMTDQRRRSFARAVELGVKVAAGTDTVGGLYRFGVHARELELYVELGMSAEQALRTATVDAAELLRRPDLGVIRTGAAADLVVLDGDPIADISLLQDPRRILHVIRAGKDVSSTLRDVNPELELRSA